MRSSVNASMRAKMRHDSRPCGSLPWTLQLRRSSAIRDLLRRRRRCRVADDGMLIGRFPGAAGPLTTGFVRPSSTMRTRGLAATSAAS